MLSYLNYSDCDPVESLAYHMSYHWKVALHEALLAQKTHTEAVRKEYVVPNSFLLP